MRSFISCRLKRQIYTILGPFISSIIPYSPSDFSGILFPEGLKYLKNAEDREEVRRICERFGPYKDLYNGVGDGPNDKTLEDKFFEEEV